MPSSPGKLRGGLQQSKAFKALRPAASFTGETRVKQAEAAIIGTIGRLAALETAATSSLGSVKSAGDEVKPGLARAEGVTLERRGNMGTAASPLRGRHTPSGDSYTGGAFRAPACGHAGL